MNLVSRRVLPIVSIALLLPALVAQAQTRPSAREASPLAGAREAVVSGGEIASPKERRELSRQFVGKWGAYVQRVYGVPVGTWAKRMAPTFATVDGQNFRRALERDSFEGAIAELSGRGERIDDRQMMARLATANDGKAFGSVTSDLLYTPVTPCRIADTRLSGGAIPAGGTRSFFSVNTTSYTVQGGSATNCGLLGTNASAVAINVTAVTPSGAGFATVYPFGASQPNTASVNYTAGAVVNNTVITPIPNPLQSSDFTIYTFAAANYVIDIVGYFAPVPATQLDCVSTGLQTFTIAASGTNFFDNPSCPAGYRATTPYCWTGSSGVYSQGSGYNGNQTSSNTFCAWQNTNASSQTVFGGNICCRIPGR
jgi:hypothetical protein